LLSSPSLLPVLAVAAFSCVVACADEVPQFPDIGFDVTVDGALTDVTGDGFSPDGAAACDSPCAALGRGACVEGVCGDCTEGLLSAGSTGSACCAPGESLSDDGLSCLLPPECEGVMCGNGGRCVLAGGTGICDCPAGTSGDGCETLCETAPLQVTSCLADGQDCLGWFPGLASTPFNGGGCDELPCFFDDEECADGWVNFTIVLDMGADVAVQQIDWHADWWSQRPESVSVFAGPSDNIGDATEVGSLSGIMHPWQCVTGEACNDSVPDDCCPNGRDAPQRIEEGALLSKWDSAELDAEGGRYFFFRVDRTFQRNAVIMQGMRAFGTECLGGLACDPEVEDCAPECLVGTERDGEVCVDIDGCEGDPRFDDVACTDVSAPNTGFECGPCPDGFEGDGVTCTSTECNPECADWESCLGGSCQARRCSEGCGSGSCFEGFCGDAGSCEAQCATRYGNADTWECEGQGYCRKINCRRGTECGSGVDCVSDPDSNSRGPGGAGVFDQTCVDGGGSRCGGTCDGLCSASSGRCSG
jgi:hypothetical protein